MGRLSAARITVCYIIGATAWVVLTDGLISWLDLWWFYSIRALAFICITGSVLHAYLRQKFRDQEGTERALVDAAASKGRLISAVSHDLRQPLQSLSLFTAVIEGADLPPMARAAVNNLRQSVDRMGQLLTEVLDTAKLEAGMVTVRRERVSVSDVLSALVDEMRPQAEAKGLCLKWVQTSTTIESDYILLTMILRNLLANAIKYTRQGKVLLGCRHRAGNLIISVYDTGMGIDPDKLKVIFDEFYQVGNVARDTANGLGLGLAIVDRTSRMLGYRVTVRSEKGRGSAFSIVVPGGDWREGKATVFRD